MGPYGPRWGRGGGGGALGLNSAGCVSLASQSPYTIIVYSAPIIDPILVTFGQICSFRNPNLVTSYF